MLEKRCGVSVGRDHYYLATQLFGLFIFICSSPSLQEILPDSSQPGSHEDLGGCSLHWGRGLPGVPGHGIDPKHQGHWLEAEHPDIRRRADNAIQDWEPLQS